MRIPRKVIAGYWEDEETAGRIGHWMRSAAGVFESRRLKVCRFGDNMREVAVTEGDKVEAQIRLGWSVNGYGVGDLIQRIDQVTEAQVDARMAEYHRLYDTATDNMDSIRYQARLEIAIRSFLEGGGFGAYTDTFEDLQQIRQLPGLATQNLMKDGYGFGAEGDWKTAALVRIMKKMAVGLKGGTAFMEDYTYHLEKGREAILGAHMLEVDPDIAADRPRIEVHEMGIGGREAPARLCFNTGNGKAITASLIDMGDRFRMIVNDVEACAPYEDMPNLPVAGVMWKPLPSLATSAEAWIMAGGAHHTVLSYQLDAEHMQDFCDMLGIEFIHIGAHTKIEDLKKELTWNDVIWKLK
jgi:L-arabinose isomerase